MKIQVGDYELDVLNSDTTSNTDQLYDLRQVI